MCPGGMLRTGWKGWSLLGVLSGSDPSPSAATSVSSMSLVALFRLLRDPTVNLKLGDDSVSSVPKLCISARLVCEPNLNASGIRAAMIDGRMLASSNQYGACWTLSGISVAVP